MLFYLLSKCCVRAQENGSLQGKKDEVQGLEVAAAWARGVFSGDLLEYLPAENPWGERSCRGCNPILRNYH